MTPVTDRTATARSGDTPATTDAAPMRADAPGAAASPDDGRTVARMHAAMHVLFVVLLVVAFVRALVTGPHTAMHVALVLITTGVFVGVYLSGLVLERRSRSTDPASAPRPSDASGTGAQPGSARPSEYLTTQAWIVALVATWIVTLLVARDFAWLAFALYFLVLHVARRALAAALVVVVLVASILALTTTPQTRGAGAIIGPIVGMVVALGIAWVYAQLRREADARRTLVLQLVAAQDDVMAAQDELARTQRHAGVVAERERLARDIHDTLAQSFSSIVLLSRAGLATAPGDATLTQIERQAADGLTQAREVVHALSPSELAEAPLFGALQRLSDRLGEQTGIDAHTHLDGTPRALPAALDVALLRIAQSALANVRLHSGATRAGLTLAYAATDVTLEIIDDGIGFTDDDIARAPLGGSGFGLRAIRERIAALGGSMTIESTPGDGAALVVTLPTAAPLDRFFAAGSDVRGRDDSSQLDQFLAAGAADHSTPTTDTTTTDTNTDTTQGRR